MKKRVRMFGLIVMLITLFSCGNSNQAYDGTKDNTIVNTGDISNQENNRKVVYTVTYEIENEDIDTIIEEVEDCAKNLLGYISTANYYTHSAKVVYRIPSESLDTFMDSIDEKETIASKAIESKEVTSEYNKIEARIKVLEASKTAYESLLLNDNLSLSEIISINKELENINTELIALYDQKGELDLIVEYSTVIIRYSKINSGQTKNSFFDDYFNYLGEFFVGLGTFILYLVPFLICGGILVAIILLSLKFSKKKKVNKDDFVKIDENKKK